MRLFYLFILRLIILLTLLISTSSAFAYQSLSVKHGEKIHYNYKDNFTNYDVQVKGDIKVTDDDSGIKSISPGGYLKVSKKTFGNKRSLIVESNASGKLSYEYYVGRTKTPYEPEGRQWLSEILLDVIRITGIDAKGRVNRIYKSKGVDGVLREINEIR